MGRAPWKEKWKTYIEWAKSLQNEYFVVYLIYPDIMFEYSSFYDFNRFTMQFPSSSTESLGRIRRTHDVMFSGCSALYNRVLILLLPWRAEAPWTRCCRGKCRNRKEARHVGRAFPPPIVQQASVQYAQRLDQGYPFLPPQTAICNCCSLPPCVDTKLRLWKFDRHDTWKSIEMNLIVHETWNRKSNGSPFLLGFSI